MIITKEQAAQGAIAIRGAVGAFSAIFHKGLSPVPTTVVEVNHLWNGLTVDMLDAGCSPEDMRRQLEILITFYAENAALAKSLEHGSDAIILKGPE